MSYFSITANNFYKYFNNIANTFIAHITLHTECKNISNTKFYMLYYVKIRKGICIHIYNFFEKRNSFS